MGMTVHIRKEFGGSALCGVPKPHFHGGPKTATCRRCLAHPISRDWAKRTNHPSNGCAVRGCWCEACAHIRHGKVA
jgi:hypothetical protein